MSQREILYLGDTSLRGAACYLTGLMTKWGWTYDYVPSDQSLLSLEGLEVGRRLFILSDYPSRLIDESIQKAILEQVHAGAGLLMIGGWESFCGQGGDWGGTPIAQALPVHIATSDDRVNCDQPALATRVAVHPVNLGQPWNERPPTIGGFNKIDPKVDAKVLLEVHRFLARWDNTAINFEPTERHPLLVVGEYGQGRTAALAVDVAPHWVGGLVDWGNGRVTAQAPGAHAIEVGDMYALFLNQLLGWTGQMAGHE